MRDGWKMTHHLSKNDWNCKPNPNSFPNTSRWLLSFLMVASYFSFFTWLLIFRWFLYSDIVISNVYVHFHHCFFIAGVLFNVGVFMICKCPYQIRPTAHFSFILWSFCKIIVTLPSIQLPSLIAPSSLSSCNVNFLWVDSCTLQRCCWNFFSSVWLLPFIGLGSLSLSLSLWINESQCSGRSQAFALQGLGSLFCQKLDKILLTVLSIRAPWFGHIFDTLWSAQLSFRI